MEDQIELAPIILVTHGTWGQALLETTEIFLGPQENLACVPLNLDESPEGFVEKLERVLDQIAGDREVLFLVDLRGGTPWNIIAVLTRRRKLQCVAGLSLPMLLEVLPRRAGLSVAELAEIAAAAGREGVINLATVLSGVASTKRSDVTQEETG
jgi:PTS system mannose-specific IIA component